MASCKREVSFSLSHWYLIMQLFHYTSEYLGFSLMEDKDPPILQSQYRCWWPGSIRKKVVGNNIIDHGLPKYLAPLLVRMI